MERESSRDFPCTWCDAPCPCPLRLVRERAGRRSPSGLPLSGVGPDRVPDDEAVRVQMNARLLVRRDRHDQLPRRQGLVAAVTIAASARPAADDRGAAERKTPCAKFSGNDRSTESGFASCPCPDSQSAGFTDLDSCLPGRIRQNLTRLAQRETAFARTGGTSGCQAVAVHHRC